MKPTIVFLAILMLSESCKPDTVDEVHQSQQEQYLRQALASVGLPAIKNFRELRQLKDIMELRDQSGLVTYTYLFAEATGKLIFFCDSIGYGIPYATQFTNPEKVQWNSGHGPFTIPQAEPNGLFSPPHAEGTWVMCKDPNGQDVKPVYVEPRIVVYPYRPHDTP